MGFGEGVKAEPWAGVGSLSLALSLKGEGIVRCMGWITVLVPLMGIAALNAILRVVRGGQWPSPLSTLFSQAAWCLRAQARLTQP